MSVETCDQPDAGWPAATGYHFKHQAICFEKQGTSVIFTHENNYNIEF